MGGQLTRDRLMGKYGSHLMDCYVQLYFNNPISGSFTDLNNNSNNNNNNNLYYYYTFFTIKFLSFFLI